MACSIFSIVRLFLVEYPLDLCNSTNFISFFNNLSWIFGMSNSFSINSICSYFIPYDFKELLLAFSPSPITVWSVSYGAPVILSIVSFGLSNADKVIERACVPDINCALTRLSSALNIFEYISSILFLPGSSIPYPVDEFKCISCRLHSWKAFITFILFFSHIFSIFENCGLICSSTSFTSFCILVSIVFSFFLDFYYFLYYSIIPPPSKTSSSS